jgi:hypothetical protein
MAMISHAKFKKPHYGLMLAFIFMVGTGIGSTHSVKPVYAVTCNWQAPSCSWVHHGCYPGGGCLTGSSFNCLTFSVAQSTLSFLCDSIKIKAHVTVCPGVSLSTVYLLANGVKYPVNTTTGDAITPCFNQFTWPTDLFVGTTVGDGSVCINTIDLTVACCDCDEG